MKRQNAYFALMKAIRIALAITFFVIFPTASVHSSQNLPEVMLLVDTSGSMKHNDPNNLRVEAARLLIELMQGRAQLSIYTFSTTTKPMLANAAVDASYLKQFNRAQSKITSNGLLTDIVGALETANNAWHDETPRTIIILTDGRIDLGNPDKDSQSKRRLFEDIIPALNHNQVRVYSIGLGAGVDKPLLNKIANKTNGLYQFLASPNDLQSGIYHFFTSAIEAQGLPIEESSPQTRQFHVDKKVSNLSITIQYSDKHSEVLILKPDGKLLNYTRKKSSAQKQFSFVDVKEPMPGKWTIKGQAQPVERALILTNLKLISTKLTGQYYHREVITLIASLKQKDELVNFSPEAAANTMTLVLKNQQEEYSTVIPYRGQGVFKKSFILTMPPGQTKSVLTIKQQDVVRDNQSLLNILPVPLTQRIDDHFLKIALKDDEIDPESVTINLQDKEKRLAFPLIKREADWQIDLGTVCELQTAKSFTMHARIKAKTTSGRALLLVLPWVTVHCDTLKPAVPDTKTSVTPDAASTKIIKPVAKQETKPEVKVPVKPSSNYYFGALIILIALLVGLVVLFWLAQGAYKRKIRKLRGQ